MYRYTATTPTSHRSKQYPPRPQWEGGMCVYEAWAGDSRHLTESSVKANTTSFLLFQATLQWNCSIYLNFLNFATERKALKKAFKLQWSQLRPFAQQQIGGARHARSEGWQQTHHRWPPESVTVWEQFGFCVLYDAITLSAMCNKGYNPSAQFLAVLRWINQLQVAGSIQSQPAVQKKPQPVCIRPLEWPCNLVGYGPERPGCSQLGFNLEIWKIMERLCSRANPSQILTLLSRSTIQSPAPSGSGFSITDPLANKRAIPCISIFRSEV